MPKVITIINMKGGVGKTTLSVNISYILARYHSAKVLLIDIDPQFNATQYLVEQSKILEHFKSKKTIFEILMPSKEEEINLGGKRKSEKKVDEDLDDYVINIKRYIKGGRLDLIPSSLKLINFETSKRGVERHLDTFIKKKCSSYDFIIIDCPPTLSILTLSAYLASQHYLIPIKPDYLSSLGLPLLERGLNEYEETFGHDLNLLGIVFTLVNARSNITQEVISSIEERGWSCFNSQSSQSVKVAEGVEKNIETIDKFYRLTKYSKYAEEFKSITIELLTKLS